MSGSPPDGMLGRARAAVQIGREIRARFVAQEIGNNTDAGIAQHFNTPPRILRMRIDEGDVHRTDAPRNHLFCARRGALMESAGLERHEGCNVVEIPLDLTQRHWFGVRLIRRLGIATRNDHSFADEHAAHRRIGQAGGQGKFSLRYGFTHETCECCLLLLFILPEHVWVTLYGLAAGANKAPPLGCKFQQFAYETGFGTLLDQLEKCLLSSVIVWPVGLRWRFATRPNLKN